MANTMKDESLQSLLMWDNEVAIFLVLQRLNTCLSSTGCIDQSVGWSVCPSVRQSINQSVTQSIYQKPVSPRPILSQAGLTI